MKQSTVEATTNRASWHGDALRAQGLVRVVIPAGLFCLVVLLALDLYSTLAASSQQLELNPLLNILAALVGLSRAVVVVKLADLVAIMVMYRAWRRSRGYDARFVLVLCPLVAFYSTVIFSNFAGR